MKMLYGVIIEKVLKYAYKGLSKLSLFLWDKAGDAIEKVKSKRRLKNIEKAKKSKDETKYNSNIDDI